jgi:DNA polymerase III epsilon subunit-like protein
MTKIIFYDTETTGNTENDRLCQLGVKERGAAAPILNEMFTPPVPISIESKSIHHITEKIIGDRPQFKESKEYSEIKTLFENNDVVSVAHNAQFDVGMLSREDINVAKTICTMKVARALDNNDVIPSYRLQYLRYYLGIEITGVNAHDAWGDVVVLEELFERLLSKLVKEKGSEEEAIKEMIRISSQPSIIRIIRFGKYIGQKVLDIAVSDRGYLEWLLKQKKENPKEEEDWIYTLENALGIAHENIKMWN